MLRSLFCLVADWSHFPLQAHGSCCRGTIKALQYFSSWESISPPEKGFFSYNNMARKMKTHLDFFKIIKYVINVGYVQQISVFCK